MELGKEGKPPASGSAPHSAARSPQGLQGASWQWPPVPHQHPPELGFQGKGLPALLGGLSPKLLLHGVRTEGPFQDLTLHMQGAAGALPLPRAVQS